jgi:hypothetical protein
MMNHYISKVPIEETADPLLDMTSQHGKPLLNLAFPKWKALLIESVIIVIGFVSVVVYNWLFKASISPVLGVIVGAANGSLVAWCITRSEQVNQDK